MRTPYLILAIIALLIGSTIQNATVQGQEFTISGNCYNSILGGGGYDGTNYLAGLSGDTISDSSLSVQFISPAGALSGNRILLGETGTAPLVAFDGTNYLLVWCDRYVEFLDNGTDAGMTNIYGRFIDPSGTFTGPRFTIATGAYIKGSSSGCLHFNGTNYFYTYHEDDGGGGIGPVYGQFISTAGTLSGSPIQISSGVAKEYNMQFDGTNYLVAFVTSSKYINGQFVSTSGTLTGSNFAIDASENESTNPLSVAFDGSRYLVAFHDRTLSGLAWNLYARFVSTSGTVDPAKVTICDSSRAPMAPVVVYAGDNKYLSSFILFATKQLKGQYISTLGASVDPEFTIFDSITGTLPLGGVGSFVGNKCMAACTRIAYTKEGKANTNLGIIGKFLTRPSGISDNEEVAPVVLFPNPATDQVFIGLESYTNAEVSIYDMPGNLLVQQSIDQHSRPVDISGLCNGIYLVVTRGDDVMNTQKLIISR